MLRRRPQPPPRRYARGWHALIVVVPLLVLMVGTAAVGAQLLLVDRAESDRATTGTVPRRDCWDGTSTPTSERCPPLKDTAGLAWVFPSFGGPDDPECRDVLAEHPDEARVLMWECRVEVLSGEAYVTYSQVEGLVRATRYFDESYGSGSKTALPNTDLADQVRWQLDQDENHSRTVMYAGARYAVTVWSAGRKRADLALDTRVELRDATSVAARGPVPDA